MHNLCWYGSRSPSATGPPVEFGALWCFGMSSSTRAASASVGAGTTPSTFALAPVGCTAKLRYCVLVSALAGDVRTLKRFGSIRESDCGEMQGAKPKQYSKRKALDLADATECTWRTSA